MCDFLCDVVVRIREPWKRKGGLSAWRSESKNERDTRQAAEGSSGAPGSHRAVLSRGVAGQVLFKDASGF